MKKIKLVNDKMDDTKMNEIMKYIKDNKIKSIDMNQICEMFSISYEEMNEFIKELEHEM